MQSGQPPTEPPVEHPGASTPRPVCEPALPSRRATGRAQSLDAGGLDAGGLDAGGLDAGSLDAGLARCLDAGLNRLCEALRVIEDQLRFQTGFAPGHRVWKELRLDAGALRARLEARWGLLARWRDATGDPGHPERSGHIPARADRAALLAANTARAREATRSLEETLRLAWPAAAAEAELLRYRVYAAESALGHWRTAHEQLGEVRLYVLLTTALAARPPLVAAAAALAGGAQMLQLREKDLPPRTLLGLARELRRLTNAHGARLIINDHVDIAALCGADGVHLGQDDLPVAAARRLLGPDAIVGVSTHDPDQAARAAEDGASYIGVGPIFPTRTKEHRSAVGLEFIAAAAAAAPIPGFAIGSVNRASLPAVLAAGAGRVAVCTAIIGSDDIEGTARWFRQQLDGAAALHGGSDPAPARAPSSLSR